MSVEEDATAEAVSAREIVSARVFEAPRARLFEAFSDPDQLVHWWGPEGFANTFHEFDMKPGGKWRFVMHGPDGSDYRNESVFVEILEPERIVVEHVSAPRFQMSMHLDEQGRSTKLTWRMLFESAAICEKVKGVVVEANEQNFDRLEIHLTKMP